MKEQLMRKSAVILRPMSVIVNVLWVVLRKTRIVYSCCGLNNNIFFAEKTTWR